VFESDLFRLLECSDDSSSSRDRFGMLVLWEPIGCGAIGAYMRRGCGAEMLAGDPMAGASKRGLRVRTEGYVELE
jgi:hypothetical protein